MLDTILSVSSHLKAIDQSYKWDPFLMHQVGAIHL